MARQYPALIHKDPDSDYGVSFPDFPGCVTAGSTPEEALEMAIEALQFHINGLIEDGERIPDPMPLDEAYRLAVEQGPALLILVPAVVPSRARKINVTIDESLLEEIDAAAKARHMSRSAFLAQGALYMMGLREAN